MYGRKGTSKICLALILVLMCGVVFSGCRESSVLEQKIYTEDATVDLENETKINNNDEQNEDEDETITSKQENEDSNKERNQSDTKAVQGDGNSTDSTAKKSYDSGANTSGQAKTTTNGSTTGSDTKSVGVNNSTGTTAGSSGDLEVVDENGETIEDDNTYDRIAATGAAGAFVEMLSGGGKLVASSASLTGNSQARSIFSNLSNVQTLWDANGTSGMTDANFQALLAAAPDLCLYDSGGLTGAQVTQLEAAGITCYPMNFSGASDAQTYKDQVTAIGGFLGGDAVKKAADYCNWYDSILRKAESKKGDSEIYTLYLSHWDSSASWTITDGTADTGGGVGVALAPSKAIVNLFDGYLQHAGVENAVTKMKSFYGSVYFYINPLMSGVRSVRISGTMGTVMKEDNHNKLTGDETTPYLGTETFPALVVSSNEVKAGIEADAASSGLWTNYGMATSDASASGYGFLVDGQIVGTTIHGGYQIYVLPQGVTGSWSTGSPESVLAAEWASARFKGGFTDDEIKNDLKDFYSTFYGVTLSDAQLSNIVAGN